MPEGIKLLTEDQLALWDRYVGEVIPALNEANNAILDHSSKLYYTEGIGSHLLGFLKLSRNNMQNIEFENPDAYKPYGPTDAVTIDGVEHEIPISEIHSAFMMKMQNVAEKIAAKPTQSEENDNFMQAVVIMRQFTEKWFDTGRYDYSKSVFFQ